MSYEPYLKTRLYVEHPLSEGGLIPLPDAQFHYLADVLRFPTGEKLALFNGKDGEWAGSFERVGKKSGQVRLEKQTRAFKDVPDIWLLFSPIKSHALDFLVQKATELGAKKLLPVHTEYSQFKKLNTERLRKTAIEAAEQTERLEVPQIAEAEELRALLHRWPAERPLYYGDEQGSGVSAEMLRRETLSPPLALLIGPEGGFSPAEHYILQQAPFVRAFSMGPRVLRAETAVVVGLTLMMLLGGDWHEKPRFRPEPESTV